MHTTKLVGWKLEWMASVPAAGVGLNDVRNLKRADRSGAQRLRSI